MATNDFIKHAFDHGINNLTNVELLALILGGNQGEDAYEKASKVIEKHNEAGGSLAKLLAKPLETLRTQYNLSAHEACALAAVQELALRAIHEKMQAPTPLQKPADVRDFLTLSLRGESREKFMIVFLNNMLHLIRAEVLFTGTLNQTTIYPREVARRAIELDAAAVILVHNHPSGVPEASPADLALTRTLQSLFEKLDIRTIDHMIVAGDYIYSFAEHGLL